MSAFARTVLRHRLLIALIWLAVFVAGIAGATQVTGRLSKTFNLPGQKGFITNQQILRTYGNGGSSVPTVIVVTVPAGTTVDSAGVRDQLAAAFDAVAAADPGWRVASWPSTGDRSLVSADGRTTVALVATRAIDFGGTDPAPAIRDALARAPLPGATVQITGLDQLRAAPGGGGAGVLAETLLGGVGALVVLIFVFSSVLAIVPLIIAAVSILTALLAILVLTAFTDISFIVQFLVSLIGLGVAIDYSLLIVTRWREERLLGKDNTQAVQVAIETAGHAVAFSGVTVAIGLLSLVFLPVPFLRSVGIAGMLIPLASVAASLTLLPVMLATIGPRMDWPHRRRSLISHAWMAWARGVIRLRWVAALGALAVLLVLVAFATRIKAGDPASGSLAQSGDSYDGLVALRRAAIPTGVLTPIELLVPANQNAAALLANLKRIDGVHGVITPTGPAWQRAGTAVVDVLPAGETSEGAGKAVVDRVRAAVPAGVQVGGTGAEQSDFTQSVYGSFPLILVAIIVITYVLLVRAFRSVLLPLKAVIMNVISVAATYGVLVLVWQDGYGSNLIGGVPATGAITNWIPLSVFAFLFGLSMDYEVFILARMREEWDGHRSTPSAIVQGLGHTGRLVTSAALILFLAFVALASGPGTDLKILATGLAVGILLDATVVRSLLVPATVSLLGRWNWWLPAWFARLLRVEPSPLVEHESAAPAAPIAPIMAK